MLDKHILRGIWMNKMKYNAILFQRKRETERERERRMDKVALGLIKRRCGWFLIEL